MFFVTKKQDINTKHIQKSPQITGTGKACLLCTWTNSETIIGGEKNKNNRNKNIYSGVSISTDGQQNTLATLLIEDSYFVLERRSN